MDPIAILTGLVSALGGLLGLAGGLCACIVPVVFLVGFGIFMYRRSQQGKVAKDAAQSWPGVMGTILSSSVQSRRTGNSMSTYPVVVYQYQVNGQTYQGQTIKAGEQFFNVRIIGEAQATADRYPVGAQVMVYYNPANPQESALER
jgi:hypothetical protein